MTQRVVFLDKDGTLIVDVPYNANPDRITLMPGAERLLRLKAAGYRLVLITNQAGVAHGYFDESALGSVERRIMVLLAQHSITLDGFYYCPHHPDARVERYRQRCSCRKPRPGLLLRAAAELDIDMHRSWFLGDILDDVEAGNRAGCRTILVDVGAETQWDINATRLPDYRARSISEAVDIVLEVDSLVSNSPQYRALHSAWPAQQETRS